MPAIEAVDSLPPAQREGDAKGPGMLAFLMAGACKCVRGGVRS